MVRVHHDEGLVKSAHRLRIGYRQGAFQLPLSRPRVVQVGANGLCVAGWVIKQYHSPALDSPIPDNARVAAYASFAPLPLQHDAPPRPGTWNRETYTRVGVGRQGVRSSLRPGLTRHDADGAKERKEQ